MTRDIQTAKALPGFEGSIGAASTGYSNSISVDSQFWSALTAELLKGCGTYVADNVDRLRFEHSFGPMRRAKATILALAASLGFYRFPTVQSEIQLDKLCGPYDLLGDQASKDLFTKLIAFRILGGERVRLPLNNAEYRQLQRSIPQYREKQAAMANIPIVGSLDLYNLQGIRLYAHPLNILNTFLLEQYRCSRAGVEVKPGDVVIDAGGCWGDTALYFAQKASRVFTFECMPENIKVMRRNLELNPTLASRIELVQNALWSSPQEKLTFRDTGPGSRPTTVGAGGLDVQTETIDHLVLTHNIQQLDLIKMDIEGSEPDALVGAEAAIRRFRPQLAISIYHDPKHFSSIPNWIAGLKLDYEMYLDHFTIHNEETVLFARAA